MQLEALNSRPPTGRSIPIPPLTGRIRDTFVAPARLARQLHGSAPWIDALLLSTLIAVISVLAIPDSVFVDGMREAITRRGDPVQISSPPDTIARWGRAIGMLSTLATHPVLIVSLAGLLNLIFTAVGRGVGSFRDYLSLTSHAMLIPAFGTLAVFVLRTVALAPVAAPANTLFGAAFVSVDPFVLWMLIVLGVGVHDLDPRHSRVSSSLILIGGYLLVVLVSTALLHPEFR